MSDPHGFVKGMLRERRGRALAEAMRSVETTPGWSALPGDVRSVVRDGVARAIGGYHDVALDMMKVLFDDTVIVSVDALEMIRNLHDRDLQDRAGRDGA